MERYVGGSRQINNVNYGTTYRAPIQRSEGGYQRPQINIDVEGAIKAATKGIAEGIKKSQEQKLEQGYNSYAKEINTIVQGLRQGAYSVEEAGNRIRSTDDRYISQGFDPLELAKRRDKYDGGVYSSVEAVQKKYEEAEAQVKIDFCNKMRERYSYMSDWSNERILNDNKQVNDMYNNIEYLTQQIGMMDVNDPGRQTFIDQRDNLLEEYGVKNTLSDLNEWIYKNPGTPITIEKLHEVRDNLVKEMVSKNKVDSRTAYYLADRIIDKSGLKALSDIDITDKKEVSDYNNLIITGMENTAKLGIYANVPEAVTLAVLPHAFVQAYGDTAAGKELFSTLGNILLNNRNGLKNLKGVSVENLYSGLSAAARNPKVNGQIFKNTLTYMSGIGGDIVDNIINPSKGSDTDVDVKNAETIYKDSTDLLNGNKSSDDIRKNKEILLNMPKLKLVHKYVQSGQSEKGVKLNDLFANLAATGRQAGIREDENGMLVMLKEHPKYGALNMFSDTQKYARQLNEILLPMEPEERKTIIKEYLGDSIYQYDKSRDGELKDISEKSIGENVEDALVNIPDVIKNFIEKTSKDSAKSAISFASTGNSAFDSLSDNEKRSAIIDFINSAVTNYSRNPNSLLEESVQNNQGSANAREQAPKEYRDGIISIKNMEEFRKKYEEGVSTIQEIRKLADSNKEYKSGKINTEALKELKEKIQHAVSNIQEIRKMNGENPTKESDESMFEALLNYIVPSANAKEFMSTSEYNARAAEIENARASGELTDDKQFQEAFDRLAKEFEGDRKEAVKNNPELLFTKVKELRKFFDEMQKAKSGQTPQTNAQIAEGRIKYASDTFGLPANIINAIFTVESNNGKDLESHTGVEGEMQITKATFKENCKDAGWTMADFYNPQAQVDVGTYYFKKQMDTFGDDIEKAAAAYNGGPTTVKRAIAAAKKAGKGTWKDYLEQSIGGTAAHKKAKAKEIRNHVKKIMKYVELYKDKQYV